MELKFIIEGKEVKIATVARKKVPDRDHFHYLELMIYHNGEIEEAMAHKIKTGWSKCEMLQEYYAIDEYLLNGKEKAVGRS